MTKFGLAAILALTSSAACAGSVFEIPVNGGTARIRIDGKCRDSLCASVSWKERGSRSEPVEYKLPEISAKTISKLIDGGLPRWKSTEPVDDDDDDTVTPPARDREPVRPRAEREPAPAPTTAPAATAPAGPVAAPSAPAAGPGPVTSAQPPLMGPGAVPAGEPRLPAGPPAPSTTSSPTIVAPARVAVAPAPPEAAAVPPAPAPAPAATTSRSSPVGEWRVEDGEGQIRIEECGTNLCGYVSAAKNPNEKDRKNPDPALRSRSVMGMPVLINMKPSGNRWKGRIYNVKDGGTYDANIALKSADTLRVEGCAFGGLVCGGQNWSRVN
jgi:uncharacterized protein (DUF2147 family)